jgi:hypothetical protein
MCVDHHIDEHQGRDSAIFLLSVISVGLVKWTSFDEFDIFVISY